VNRIKIIQEDYSEDPWKVLVCCILLNQTSNKQVRPLIENFFKKWPTSKSVMVEEDSAISDFIKTTGFQNVKAKRIKQFSSAWESGIRDPFKFPGIGDYGREAWRIFVTEDLSFIPKDKKLKMYLEGVR
jgi:methyl-CpG-binding domain protein 4